MTGYGRGAAGNAASFVMPTGCFILTDYFAESESQEREYFAALRRLKTEQGMGGGFYHFDTPLTVEHEMATLERAGFSRCGILQNWGATYTIEASGIHFAANG